MNRRRFLQQASGLAALTAAEFAPWQAMGAFAKEVGDFVRGPAVKDHPLRRVSPHVWMIHSPDGFPTPENQGMMRNLTFVDTAKGIVVVDSGALVQIGEMAIRQLRNAFGQNLPIYAHAGTIRAVGGLPGDLWRGLMERWANQATLGTRVVPPSQPVEHGSELKFGDVTLRLHHYGKVHTPDDICVEVLEDRLTCVGNVAMDRRIANLDDGSYLGTFKAYAELERNAASRLWLPGHGQPGAELLGWNRALFEGIYRPCEQAIKDGQGMDEAKAIVLRDPRVTSQGDQGLRDQYRQVRQPRLPGGGGGRLLIGFCDRLVRKDCRFDRRGKAALPWSPHPASLPAHREPENCRPD